MSDAQFATQQPLLCRLGLFAAALIAAADNAIRSGTGCKTKGNVSASTERIYHVPGQRYYDDTRIS